jgi:hypothetical protein
VARGGTLFAAGSGIDEGCTADGSTPAGARLFLVQGSQRVSVAHVATSGADHSFSISFGVPATLQPGNASVVAQTTLDPHETPLATASVSVQ